MKVSIDLPLLPLRQLNGDLTDAKCPSRSVLDHVTSSWGVLVLIALLDGTHRFSALARRVNGISEKMLAQTLQALEGDGFVLRTVHPTVPPRVEYELTGMGSEVAGHIKGLTNWVEQNLPRVMEARSQRPAPRGVPQPRVSVAARA